MLISSISKNLAGFKTILPSSFMADTFKIAVQQLGATSTMSVKRKGVLYGVAGVVKNLQLLAATQPFAFYTRVDQE